MPRLEFNPEEHTPKPIILRPDLGDDGKKESKIVERATENELFEKIGDITYFLKDNLPRIRRKSDEEIRGNLFIVNELLKKLSDMIHDPEIKIIRNSSLADRLGNFEGGLPRILRIIDPRKTTSLRLRELNLIEAQKFKSYLEKIVNDHEFLKKELEQSHHDVTLH